MELEKAILRTIIYSDIFDYPLLKDELWRFLVGKYIEREVFENVFKNLPKRVDFRDNFYYLSGRKKITQTRLKRKKESKVKIVIAKKIIRKISHIPTVKFVGISGALSLENSERDDDIDLFVITSRERLWLTRLTMVVLLLLMGKYRRRNQRQVCDKICLNMMIDESSLRFPRDRHDLYTAHEIVQLMPVFERNNMYQKFINANRWVEKYLPNAVDIKILRYKDIKNKEKKSLSISVSQYPNIFFSVFEKLARTIQLWHIKKYITIETISDSFLAFHPFDYKKKVLSEYKKRLRLIDV